MRRVEARAFRAKKTACAHVLGYLSIELQRDKTVTVLSLFCAILFQMKHFIS